MRTWGRVPKQIEGFAGIIGYFNIGHSPIGQGYGEYDWVEVETDQNGYNDAVWLTTLAQVVMLNPGESPMFGNYGVPSQQAVVTQIPPDINVMLMQQVFSVYFLSLLVARLTDSLGNPEYLINATANPGATLMNPVPI